MMNPTPNFRRIPAVLATAIALLLLLAPTRPRAQVGADIGMDMVFNHTDFMLGFLAGPAFEKLDLSTRLNVLVRPGRKRVLVESETPDLFYQYRESRVMIGLDAEKRFTLSQFSDAGRVGAFVSAWGGVSLGGYRGTSAAAPGGFNYVFRGGPFLQQDELVLQLGYAYMPLRTSSVVAHRVFIGFHIMLID